MKIAYVLDDTLDVSDGVQQAVLTVGEHMRHLGHDVHYLAADTKRTDIPNIHPMAKSVKVSFNGNKMRIPLPVSRSKIDKVLKKERFDVLHVQMPYSPLFVGKLISRAPREVKIVGTFHILPYSKVSTLGSKLLGIINRQTLLRINHLVSVSEPAMEFFKDTCGLSSVVIPNPVDIKKFSNPSQSETTKKRIVFLGRLVQRKGAMELINAYSNLLSMHKELIKTTELVIAGKGPMESILKSKVSRILSEANVSFTGFIKEDDKVSLLASAELAVFPSTAGESFGIVLVEAMASGSRLILAGDNPGYKSVLSNFPQLTVDVRNEDLFAERIYELLSDNDENRKISLELRQEALKYDVEMVASKLLELYNS